MRMVFPSTSGRWLDELSTDMNAFFESILGEQSPTKSDFSPSMDFEDRAGAYELSIDLPGVEPDQIHVDVEDDSVAIHGAREPKAAPNADGRYHIERTFGSFRRVVRLPKLVDKDAIVAKYEHGVLTVTLPKAAKSARRVVVAHEKSASVDP